MYAYDEDFSHHQEIHSVVLDGSNGGTAIVEPLSVDDLTAHAQIDYPEDVQVDQMPMFITAAREECETYCCRSFPTQTRMQTMDRLPFGHGPIRLLYPPIQSVTSVKYLDVNGNLVTLDPSQYIADLNPISPRLVPAHGVNGWPTTQERITAVQITYVAGYATVPQSARLAMSMLASAMYNERNAQVQEELYTNDRVLQLLSPLRTF